ncbi:glycosyltransferase [Campylobacter sp. faydin G-140]|uniref:glycosyltransferase n=1 Tax=Campylobacter anatolicus TaxID=2829105 RepID=UPI001B9928BE|nr:glycosyltransferase [Campylobacter anatolicus]MBR8465222.1 glycosyltransferase [Campylobacter anatolicus]
MNIALFSCSAMFGGVEKIIVDSANELSKSEDVLVIVPNACSFRKKFDKKVQIYEYRGLDKRYNPFLYLEIAKILRNFKVQILHTHGAKATQMGFLLSKFMSFTLVATKHNNRKGKIFNRVKNIISVSKAVAKTINHESKTIYFGINPKTIIQNLPDKFCITAVGRLDKIKGFDLLIKSVAELKFDFILRIVGAGSEQKNLKALINSLNLNSKVKMLGFRDDIDELLATSHLQVISSHFEGMPINLIEGIFYSPIIISTNVGGIGEILDKNFLITHENMSEKITEIYNNYNIKKAEFINAHDKFKEILTLENYILNLKQYYKDIL